MNAKIAHTPDTHALRIVDLGVREYEGVWRAMQQFTQSRTATTMDELWFVEHPPVFTQGLNGAAHHILRASEIPIVKVDRGGQVTYHGPGQLVMYPLLDLSRLNIGVKQLVHVLEQIVIDYLQSLDITSTRRANAPGVYVGAAKIAALGLRIRRQSSYHGLSLNIDMDLSPFGDINPCGYAGMAVTQLRDIMHAASLPGMPQIKNHLLDNFCKLLGYNINESHPDFH